VVDPRFFFNDLAERAADCTVSRALTGTEITLEASVAGGLPDVDSGRLRSQLAGWRVKLDHSHTDEELISAGRLLGIAHALKTI